MSNVTPFHRNGQYTDIRVAVRDALDKNPDSTKGILILFKEGDMDRVYVCSSMQMAFAAADLLCIAGSGSGDEAVD